VGHLKIHAQPSEGVLLLLLLLLSSQIAAITIKKNWMEHAMLERPGFGVQGRAAQKSPGAGHAAA
jgi:hypothetical protein